MCQTCDVTLVVSAGEGCRLYHVDRLKALMYKGQGHVQGWMYINKKRIVYKYIYIYTHACAPGLKMTGGMLLTLQSWELKVRCGPYCPVRHCLTISQ